MKFKKFFATVLSALMLLSCVSLTAFAADELTLKPSKDTVVRNDTFSVSLPVSATKSVAIAEITMTYDTTAFEFTGGSSEFSGALINESAPGTIKLSMSDITASKSTGNLLVANFRVKGGASGGSYDFEVVSTDSTIKDKDKNVMDYTFTKATVTVTAPVQLAQPVVTIGDDKKVTWTTDAHAAEYDVVVQKGTTVVYNHAQTDAIFDLAAYITETAEYKVEVTAKSNSSLYTTSLKGTATKNFVVDAALSIYSKDYVTGSDGFDVVMTLNGNTLDKIAGAADLTNGTEYTESGNVIHFKDEYLKTITGTQNITFTFSAGAAQVLKVKVVSAADDAFFVLAEKELAAGEKYIDVSGNDLTAGANDGTAEGAIVVTNPTAPVTNFIAAQFAISNSADVGFDKVEYEIVPAEGFALLYDEEHQIYEINVKPVNGVRPAVSETNAGEGIVIGKLVCKGGYGKGTITASNMVVTVETSDNSYRTMNATVKPFSYFIPEPKANLQVNVSFAKLPTVTDNAKAYQNMKVRVYSARLGFIDFELGKDTIPYNEKVGTLDIAGTVTNAENSYALKLENLPKFDQYTVFISGDGYRDAKVQFALNENTTVNFWNNANDSALNYVVKEISGTEKTITKNFLAGDVIMNGVIDLYDLSAVSSYFGKGNLQVGDDAYVQYDLNRDHNINILDITMLLAGWAE